MSKEEERPATIPPVRKVLKRRKKTLGLSCDKDCAVCRTPCENPISPEKIRKRENDKQ